MRLPRKVYFLSYECDNSFSNKLGLSLKQLLHACKWHGFTTIIIPLQGQCYVMTANLDGETSLKTRHSAALTKVQHKNLGISKTSTSRARWWPAKCTSWLGAWSARTQIPSWTPSWAGSLSGVEGARFSITLQK